MYVCNTVLGLYVCNIILETVESTLETLLVVVAVLVWMGRVTLFSLWRFTFVVVVVVVVD